MSKSSGRVLRDILILVVVIALILVWYLYMRNPQPADLGQDIHIDPAEIPPQDMASGAAMAHGENIFPEEGDDIVAIALNHEISEAELNQEANRIFRKMNIDPGAGMANNEEFLSMLRFQALGELLTALVIMDRATELGINSEEIVDKAMAEWSEGFDTPEEKLASIKDSRGVTMERMRAMYFRELVLPLVITAVTENSEGDTPEEKEEVFNNWIIQGLKNLDIEFRDDELKNGWEQYIAGIGGNSAP